MLCGSASARNPLPIEQLRPYVQRALRHAEVRGASVTLVRGGELVWSESFGVRDTRSGEAVTSATSFEAASIGKVVAAYAALSLVEEGVWSLDMSVASPALDVPDGCEAPSLLQLLTHTAGLGNYIWAERFRGACRPPAEFHYAGQGWLVLQHMLEAQTGEPAEDFVRKRVLDPLDMRRSTYASPPPGDVAIGHVDAVYGTLSGTADPGVRVVSVLAVLVAVACGVVGARSFFRRHERWAAAGLTLFLAASLVLILIAAGSVATVPVEPWSDRVLLPSSLHTTAEDLARFARELLQPRLLRPATRDLLFAPRVDVDAGIAWGAGIGIDRSAEPTTWWHWGSNPGFQGLFVVEPASGDALVVLTNTGGFLDFVSYRRGGYNAAKRIARKALGIHGRWDIDRDAPD